MKKILMLILLFNSIYLQANTINTKQVTKLDTSVDMKSSSLAEWKVIGLKDNFSRLIVTPTSVIIFDDFKDQIPALYEVKIINYGLNRITNFKLEAKATGDNELSDGHGNSMRIQLSKENKILRNTDYMTLINNGEEEEGFINFTGNPKNSKGHDVEVGTEFFTATLIDFKQLVDGKLKSVSDPNSMPAGLYTGHVQVNFKATWYIDN